MVSAIDIAWAAGFIEGEGSFGHPTTACVRASQVQREPLERLQRMFGGTIRLSKRNRNDSRNANTKDIWSWYVYSNRAAGAIMSMLCLLSPKRKEQAIASLDAWKNQPGRSRAGQTHCKHGHEFTGENVKVNAKTGYRQCRACIRTSAQRIYAERSH